MYCGLAEVLTPKEAWVRKSQIHKLQIRNHKKDWVCKLQIPQVSHLRKVRKSNKLFMHANFRICDFRNLFADRPPLLTIQLWRNKMTTLSSLVLD